MSTNTKSQDHTTPTTFGSSMEESPSGKSSSAPMISGPAPEESSSTGSQSADQQNEEPQQEPTTEDDGDQETSPESKERKEAKRYRLQLRATEERLSNLAEHVVAGKLDGIGLSTKALRAAGHDPAQFFNDSNEFDDAALLAAVNATAETLGVDTPANLAHVNAAHDATGAVNWKARGSHGHVPSAGTGGERPPRKTYDQIKQEAYEQAQQQKGSTAPPPARTNAEGWQDLMQGG